MRFFLEFSPDFIYLFFFILSHLFLIWVSVFQYVYYFKHLESLFNQDGHITNFYTIYTFLLSGDTPSLTLNNYGTQRSYLTF